MSPYTTGSWDLVLADVKYRVKDFYLNSKDSLVPVSKFRGFFLLCLCFAWKNVYLMYPRTVSYSFIKTVNNFKPTSKNNN